jgi:very-short-patch-repair endonuclease
MKDQDAQRHQIKAGAKTKRSINPKTTRARQLRRSFTDAERKLWTHLRGRQLRGVKFRRQQPLGPYIVDFCSLDPKLVIEVDGGQHAQEVERDAIRTAALEQMGYGVIRFWNNDVLQNIEGVWERIAEAIDASVAGDDS